MLFHSFTFLVFIVVVYTLLRLFPSNKKQKPILLFASYVFYMWWNPALILLVIYSTLVDYWSGLKIEGAITKTNKKRWVYISIIANLMMLFFFKYFNFFQDMVFYFQQQFGYEPSWTMVEVILPLGISFYTFQSMSYTIDVYREKLKPTSSFLDFSLYISFFPQMIAGPIVRAVDFLPQLYKERNLNFSKPVLFLFAKGLFKKVIIADNINYLTTGIYSNLNDYSAGVILMSSFFCYIQLYCDFSGYSDMAIALGRSMGFQFPENFKKPFTAHTLTDFWRRWHITLSSWFRDYVYISLGGSKKRMLINVFLVMTIAGLWHGAGINFFLWGIVHGILLSLEKLFKLQQTRNLAYQAFTQVTFMVLLILFWSSEEGAISILIQKFSDFNLFYSGIGYLNIYIASLVGFIFIFFHYGFNLEEYFMRWNYIFFVGFWVVYGFVFFSFAPTYEQPFIYFQF